MEGDGIRDSASGSSLETCETSTPLVRRSEEATGLSRADVGSALGELMSSMSLGSEAGAALVSDLDATGGSTRSAGVDQESPMRRSESFTKAGSSVASDDVLSRGTEKGDFSMILTPETGSKSAAGDSFISELPIGPVPYPGYKENAHRDMDDRFTPVELRAAGTSERGEIVGDLSGEGGFVYTTDLAFKNSSLALVLESPVPGADQKEKTRSSFGEATPEDLRLTSTPVRGHIVGDLGSGHLYSKDLEAETSGSTDPCSPVPVPEAP